MIPKKIHYFWFGKKEKPSDIIKYIETWKKYLPDYEIIEWNESNFDIEINKFVKEAYENKQWAFVSDYGRLYVLYKYGGIYMDTDVEVCKNMDELLKHSAFTGMEGTKQSVTGIMGAVKNHKWIKLLLSYYNNKSFVNKDGSFNNEPNTSIITKITTEKYKWIPVNKIQYLEDNLVIYPHDYFCAKSHSNGILKITNNTFTIHHFKGSWLSDKQQKSRRINDRCIKMFGKTLGTFIGRIINNLRINGIFGTIKKIFRRNRK